jgi:hypothetical protein
MCKPQTSEPAESSVSLCIREVALPLRRPSAASPVDVSAHGERPVGSFRRTTIGTPCHDLVHGPCDHLDPGTAVGAQNRAGIRSRWDPSRARCRSSARGTRQCGAVSISRRPPRHPCLQGDDPARASLSRQARSDRRPRSEHGRAPARTIRRRTHRDLTAAVPLRRLSGISHGQAPPGRLHRQRARSAAGSEAIALREKHARHRADDGEAALAVWGAGRSVASTIVRGRTRAIHHAAGRLWSTSITRDHSQLPSRPTAAQQGPALPGRSADCRGDHRRDARRATTTRSDCEA